MSENVEIEVNDVSKYKSVEVSIGSTTFDLGLFDNQEAQELAETLVIAAENLLDGISDSEQELFEGTLYAVECLCDTIGDK